MCSRLIYMTQALFDSHVHTGASHDSTADPNEVCASAAAAGLSGLAFTDHYEGHEQQSSGRQIWNCILRSFDSAKSCQREFAGQLQVFAGVEIGEGLWNLPLARELLAARPFDTVLASVHVVRHPQWKDAFSRIDFSALSQTQTLDYLHFYFADLQQTAQLCDYDILSHLTVPLRYINGRYAKAIPLAPFMPAIETVLRTLIAREKTLEVNTSGLYGGYGLTMPQKEILQLYRNLGGTLVSLGSDAHTPQHVGGSLQQGLQLLRECGFTRYVYYRQRKPEQVSITP